jgi:hypothetical protein
VDYFELAKNIVRNSTKENKVMNNDLNSFEDYLHGVVFPKLAMGEGLLDDEWTDREADWMAELPDEFQCYANEYARAKVKAVHAEYLVILRKVEENLKEV